MASVERFAALFRGYEHASGSYTPLGKSASGKVEGRALTQKVGARAKDYGIHLNGLTPQLGIIPLLEDDTVVFGAIDIDVKGIDLQKLEEDAKELPLVVCRSKSAGAHLYLFGRGPLPATLVVERLSEWAAALGHGGCEVFPKQTSRVSKNDLGNWINIPYEGILDPDYKTQRYAILNGEPVMDLDDFCKLAESRRVDAETLASIQVEGEPEEFVDGPPCLQRLTRVGFGEGSRKDGLFSVGVYFKKKNDTSWENDILSFNLKFMTPPLPNADVQDVIKSLKKKDYVYKCKQPPLKPFCNKRKCLGQPFGIGVGGVGAASPLTFGSMIKYETTFGDAYWVIECNGQRLEISDPNDLLSQARFARIAFERLNLAIPSMPGPRWTQQLQNLLQFMEVVEIPAEASEEGQFRELVTMFLETMQTAKSRDGLILGQGWTEDGMAYFRSLDLFAYLDSRRFRLASKKQAWAYLARMGAVKKGLTTSSGTFVNTWGLPATHDPDEPPLDVPDFKNEESF